MRFRVVSTAALLAVVPGISSAVGLGDETVRSYLNAPLNAEIELIATPEELATVQVQLASREDFIRHGLDYPGFFTSIQVRSERLPDGRNVIRLSSSQAMVEPFLVVLVDVRTSGSRVLREYTLLLDPPTFQPQQAPAAPVAVPGVASPPATATVPPPPVTRPAAPPPVAPTSPPAVSAAPAAAPSGGGGRYTVQRGDTLSRIASREYGAGQSSQAMMAIYRANPGAFSGNINLLEAGATLDLPEQAAISAVSRSEATAEVRSQMTAWLSTTPSTPETAEARLRLVPPGGPAGTGASEGNKAGTAPAPAAPDRPVTLESPDLARLQQNQKPAEPPAPAESAAAPEPAEGDVDASELGVAEPAPVEPPAAEPAAPAAREPAPAKPTEEQGPGLLERLLGYWPVLLGGAALVAVLLGLVAARRRRAASSTFAPLTPSLDELDLPEERDTSSDTFPLRKPADNRDSTIVVEETGEHERPAFRRETQTVDLEEGASSGNMTAAALEQGDPLAEADFHMAYGLYDQAADLVKAALKREPQRRDLKLKLLEVFFVWGNKDQFLQTARDLAKTRDAGPPGEWEKVVIMGKQLAPEDVLFHNFAAAGSQTSVDLNLEGGQNLIDFDLPDMDGTTGDSGVDMQLSETGLQPLDSEGGLDLLFDAPDRNDDSAATATTRQMAQPGLDAINAPTLEQPALDIDDTLAGKVDAHGLFSGSPDQTAELALDDLGLDLGKLEGTGTGMMPPVPEDVPSDAPTMVAGLDETSRELLANAADASQRTEMLPLTDLDLGTGTGIDLDIDFGGDTGKAPLLDTGTDLDLDVGEAAQPEGEWQSTQRIDPTLLDVEPPRDLEPVTMSEVGTKLDLARAYMDMGDPDGARSILNEVLQEGSESQCKEAQRLLDSIPG